MIENNLDCKEFALTRRLLELDSVIVAYSGGVDSSLLAFYARKVLGSSARVVTAVSASLADSALTAARAQAEMLDWDLIEVRTEEIELPEYRANDGLRCFYCKATLFAELARLADQWQIAHIAYGANVDDSSDYRPGDIAARQFKVVSPLQDAGLTKEEIRALAHKNNLPSWNRPQDACLASRIPAQVPVSIETLSQVEQAERFVSSLGFRQVRVRHHGRRASVEVGADEVGRFAYMPGLAEEIEKALQSIGYKEVDIDRQGYRTGSVSAHAFVEQGQ